MDIDNWYWRADGGRIWSSKIEAIVPANDPDFVAWDETFDPTPWPRDLAGEQTDAELQSVVGVYGKNVNLHYYNIAKREWKLMQNITVNGRPFATDPITLSSLNSAYIYTTSNANQTFAWKLPDGSYVELGKQDVTELQGAVTSYGQACHECEANVEADIIAAIVTTREQVDAAYDAIQNDFTGMKVEFKKWQKRK